MEKYYLLNTFKNPRIFIVFAIIIIYSSFALFNPDILLLTSREDSPEFVLANYTGYFSLFPITAIILPLFFIFIQPIINHFQNIDVLTRHSYVRKISIQQSLITFVHCMLFIFFLYFIVFFRCIYFQQIEAFFKYLYFFIKSAILQIFSFNIIATLFYIFRLLYGNTIAAFLNTYAVFLYNYLVYFTIYLPSIYITEAFYIYPGKSGSYLFLLVVIIIINIPLIIIKHNLLGTKDWIKKIQ